jgi:hypothetical protein
MVCVAVAGLFQRVGYNIATGMRIGETGKHCAQNNKHSAAHNLIPGQTEFALFESHPIVYVKQLQRIQRCPILLENRKRRSSIP